MGWDLFSIVEFILVFGMLLLLYYDKVSANTASSFSQCYERSDRSQDARRGSQDQTNSFQNIYDML